MVISVKQLKAPVNEATRGIIPSRIFNFQFFLLLRIGKKLRGSKILWYKNAIKSLNIGGRGQFLGKWLFLLPVGFFSGFLPPEKSGNADT